jgi:hypothetical protein
MLGERIGSRLRLVRKRKRARQRFASQVLATKMRLLRTKKKERR